MKKEPVSETPDPKETPDQLQLRVPWEFHFRRGTDSAYIASTRVHQGLSVEI